MNILVDTTEAALEAALDKCGGHLERIGAARWRLALVNGRSFGVSAAVDTAREWLHLDADAGADPDAARLWSALVLNGTLAGAAKIALLPAGLRLRAEVPLERRDVLAARIASTCSGFKDALSALDTGLEAAARDPGEAGSGLPRATAGLAADCRESGWNVSERSNGSVAVHLECARRFYQALVEPRPSGGVVISTELIREGVMSAASRAALATLLLATTAILRLARAAAGDEGGRTSARLEVAFDTMPDATDLNHALSALSAGCSLAGDEARVLQLEAVASRYLALRNPSTVAVSPNPRASDRRAELSTCRGVRCDQSPV